jgi:hypothetical protein
MRVGVDGRGDIWLDVVLLVVVWLHIELLVVVWFSVILLLLLWQARHAHPCIPEAVEDVNATRTHARGLLWKSLKHGCHETGEDVVDLGDEERAEAGVTVAEGGEEEEELVEVVGWCRCEGVGRWGRDGEDIGEGVSYVEEFLDEADAVDVH